MNTLVCKLRLLTFVLLSANSLGIGQSNFNRETDSLVLVELYNATDGPNWTNIWDLNMPMDVWYGVSLDNEGRVTKIDLGADFIFSNNLVGSIPADIGNLTKLTTLDISSNEIYGQIPPEIANLNMLGLLDLSENEITGQIPPEICNLTKLNRIDLSFNQLTGSIPSGIGNLNSLWYLNLSYNQIEGSIPHEIENNINLTFIRLSNNALTDTIPSGIASSNFLWELDLSFNNLNGQIPHEIGDVTDLDNINLSHNQLTGEIPLELLNLDFVFELDLSYNNLTGSLPATLSFPFFTSVDFSNNNLTGCFPDSFNQNCSVKNLSSNLRLPWQGDLVPFCNGESQIGAPCDDGNELTELDQIRMDCECIGRLCIPFNDSLVLVSIYNQTNGENWSMPWNLDEPIENWNGITLSPLGCVQKIELINQGLQGPIPSEIGNFSRLEVLDLSNNQLTGNIPEALMQLIKLTTLSLRNNQLTGNIPTNIDKLIYLTDLNVFNNQLTGPIPDEISNLANLKTLFLNNNLLIGSIPEAIADLPDLSVLFLRDNLLSGCVPSGFLDHCDLLINFSNNVRMPWEGDIQPFCNNENQIGAPCDDGNEFSDIDHIRDDCSCQGVICNVVQDSLALLALYHSTDGENWSSPWDLDAPMSSWAGIALFPWGCVQKVEIKNQDLDGVIPKDFYKLSGVEYIEFSLCHNLSGPILSEIGNLTELTYFELKITNCNGPIPKEIGNLTKLETLKLSFNNMIGPIPSEIGNLTNLIELKLSSTNINGPLPSEIGNLTELESLFIVSNQLVGEIPPEIGQLTKLTKLLFSHNKFSGSLPAEIVNLPNLEEIHLTHNNFIGCIPESYREFCDDILRIDNNPQLPWEGDRSKFCNLLIQVSATCNDGNEKTFNDHIQQDCSCKGTYCNPLQDSLALIALYNNTNGSSWNIPWEIDAPMSTWVGITRHESGCVQSVQISDQNLIGFIPDAFYTLSAVEEINISNNPGLSGAVLDSIGNLKFLKQLNLCCNNLEGELPAELALLYDLESIDLSNNENLTGPYPTELLGLCPLGNVSFDFTGLPDWDHFCNGGLGSDDCDFDFCLDSIVNFVEYYKCGDYYQDSLIIDRSSIGTCVINQINYTYLNIELLSPSGQFSEVYKFYGCEGIEFEHCDVNETTLCDQLIFDGTSFEMLEFDQLWDCSMEFPNCITESADLTQESTITIYPNPTTHDLYIKGFIDGLKELSVYNTLGQLIHQLETLENITTINVSNWQEGTYVIRILHEGKFLHAELVVVL